MFLNKPSFWKKKKFLLLIVLYPLSLIVIFFSKVKLLKKTNKFSFPIVCVGNLYLGGTGKTPISIYLFNLFKSFGKKPAYVKKFYKFLNDEINLLEETGKVYQNNDREKSLIELKKDGFDVAILDDGYQDNKIYKNLSILCFHSNQLIGNGYVIPAGPLREPLSSVKRADCIFVNGIRNISFEQSLLKYNPSLNFFYYTFKLNLKADIQSKKVLAFAGIGNPENFFSTLEDNNFNIINKIKFPDHYYYSNYDINKLIKSAEKENAILLTTKKDYFRLNNEELKAKVNYIDISVIFEKQNELNEYMKKFI